MGPGDPRVYWSGHGTVEQWRDLSGTVNVVQDPERVSNPPSRFVVGKCECKDFVLGEITHRNYRRLQVATTL